MENNVKIPQILIMELPYNLTVLLLNTDPRGVSRDTNTPIFTTTSFTTAKYDNDVSVHQCINTQRKSVVDKRVSFRGQRDITIYNNTDGT